MAIDCYRGGWDGKCFITMIPTIFITILVKLLSVWLPLRILYCNYYYYYYYDPII